MLTRTSASFPKSLCILRLSAIGDTCNALAAVLAIRKASPETRITWIIGKVEAQLLASTPDIEFIIFDKQQGLAAHKKLRRELNGRRFDAALLMHASMRANFASLAIRADRKIGFDTARAKDFQSWFSRERIEPRFDQHVLDGFLQFAEHLGIPSPRAQFELAPTCALPKAAERTDNRRRLLISPCSSQRSRNFRNWSAENYAAVCDYVAERYDVETVLTGGRTSLEANYGTAIVALSNCQPTNLIGKSSLPELYALISDADLVLCPDSGPLHMAVMANTPVVGLYAGSNPARTGPYRFRELTVDCYAQAAKEFLGKDASELSWGQRVRDPNVMDLISKDAVCEKIDQVFATANA